MRRLVWLVVVIAVLIAVDSAARSYTSNQIETRLAGAVNVDERPQVAIDGFPFLASAIDGEFENMTIYAERPGWGSGPVELSDVTLTLHQVEFSLGEVLRNELRTVEVESAEGTARIKAGLVSEALSKINPTGSLVPLLEDGTVPVEGDRLQIGPLSLPLPTPLRGMTFERAELVEGAVHLEFSLSQTSFRVS
jgi:hypothetical protein